MKPEDDPEARIRELERPLADTARASEDGGGQAPTDYSYPTGSALPPATPPPSYGSPSPWASPRPSSRNRLWWLLAAFFIIGTIAVPLGLAAFGIHRATHGGFVSIPPMPSITTNTAAPSASAAQTSAPASSTPPSAAPTATAAGASLTISGINESRTIACNHSAITVSGISNQVVITGHCASLNVSGVKNSITVDAVDTIDASGFNNQISYHTGSPTIENSGQQNLVQQG
jgi:hypothetical protein